MKANEMRKEQDSYGLPKMYTADEIAKILGVSKATVRNYIYDGKLKSVKLMGSLRIKEKDLLEFLGE